MSILQQPDTTKPKSQKKRITIAIISVIIAIVLGTVLYLGISLSNAARKIISQNTGSGSILFSKKTSDIKPADLAGEGDGRINIAVYGLGGDGHPGGNLSDVIKIISIDPVNKKAAILSVPRDLWVNIPGHGFSKINAAFADGEQAKKDGGPDLANQTLSTLLNIPIHYYIRLDFDALKELVDAVGGVTIDVTKPINDPLYPAPDMIHYQPFYLKAGVQHMNGDIALKFSRSRETSNDFERAARQNQVIAALKDQAFSAGILTNPAKIANIFSILGNHVRTDLQLNEIQQLIVMIKDIDSAQIITKVLDTAPDSPLTALTDQRGYIIVPRNGDYKYAALQDIAHSIFTNPFLTKENSAITVMNASGKTGLGASVSAILQSNGYKVAKVANNPTKENFTQLIDYTGKNPFTVSFLEKRFGVKAQKQTPPVGETADLVLVLGADYATSSNTK